MAEPSPRVRRSLFLHAPIRRTPRQVRRPSPSPAVPFVLAGIGIGVVETAHHAAVAALASVDLRGSAFGQSLGNLAASSIAGLLWTLLWLWVWRVARPNRARPSTSSGSSRDRRRVTHVVRATVETSARIWAAELAPPTMTTRRPWNGSGPW